MNLPQHLKYTKTHEWVRLENDGALTIGITHHAEQLLGDIVYVELPSVGKSLAQGAEALVVESVKAAAEVYAPVSGAVIATNEALTANPELINQSPYEAGWIFRLQPATSDLSQLLDAEAYYALCAAH